MYLLNDDERKWFANLEEDNALMELPYGGILSHIHDLVKERRKELRNQRIEKLINSITNRNLTFLVNIIKKEASMLKNYNRKNWNSGLQNKKSRLKFFTQNDISIQYLEETYQKQIQGFEKVSPSDLVIVCEGNDSFEDSSKFPGLVIESFRSYAIVQVFKAKYSSSKLNEMEPIWHRYKRSRHNNKPIRKKVHMSKCKKVGVLTSELSKKIYYAIKLHNEELDKRKKFWKEKIEPVIGNWHNWNISMYAKKIIYSAWFIQENNVWNGQMPIYYDDYSIYYNYSTHGIVHPIYLPSYYNVFKTNWDIISSIVNNN